MSEVVEAISGGGEGRTHERACLNCGACLLGPHCHGCGQKAHVHRTISAFMHDLVHGALHFEGRIWHTLPLLAVKPGRLTRHYIEGQRARFVSPMALFLFSVFLMFAVFQLAGISPPDDLDAPVSIGRDDSAAETDGEQLAELRAARESLGDDNPAASIIDAQIVDLENTRDEAEPDPGTPEAVVEGVSENGRTGIALLDKLNDKWRANPGLMVYKLQTNGYKFSWLLIPLSIPFVWLLFAWRRRFKAYDHAIFVTYSLAFMTLFMIALTLLGLLGVSGGAILMAFTILAPIHIYKQLRGAYELTRFSAAWRLAVLLVFILVIVLLFLQALVLVGLF